MAFVALRYDLPLAAPRLPGPDRTPFHAAFFHCNHKSNRLPALPQSATICHWVTSNQPTNSLILAASDFLHVIGRVAAD